jgi:hypothetical protein
MSSFALALLLLAGGGGQRPPEEPNLLVVLQTPEKAGDPAQLAYFDWATGHEHWRSALALRHRPDSGDVRVAGSDFWVILRSKTHGDLLAAVELATGRERFRVAGRYLGAPTAEGSRAILFHQGEDGVVAVDSATGAELWRRRDLVAIAEYVAIVGRRVILPVGTDYRALDPVTGEDRWTMPQERGYLNDCGDLLWVSRPAPVGIDPKTGAERRQLKVPEGGTLVTFCEGKAYIRSADRLDAVRLSDAATVWSQPLGRDQQVSTVWEQKGRVQALLSPSNRYLCLEARSGRRLCELDFPASEATSTGLRNGRVGARWFDRGEKGNYEHLWIFDVLLGRYLWKGAADDEWGSSVREEVYLAKGRELFRVDVDAGGARWTATLPEAPGAKLAGPGCTVVVCGGHLLCYSAATGKPLWDARLPQNTAVADLGASLAR